MLTLTGCEGSSEEMPNLEGTWVRYRDLGYTMTLNADGTGRRGGISGESFDWTTTRRELRINRRNARSNEIANERWSVSLENDILRIESRQQSGLVRTYIRDGAVGEVDQSLVGAWYWNTNFFWEYVFDADGTGRRGIMGEMSSFTWGVVDDTMRIRLNTVPAGHSRNEHWTFDIDDGSLRLENRHDSRQAFSYIRNDGHGALGAVDPALVGRWHWDNEDYPTWRYLFNDDGTGNRGRPADVPRFMGALYPIYWGVVDGELRILPQQLSDIGVRVFRSVYNVNLIEYWTFDIDGYILQMENIEDSSQSFEYTREES